MIDGLTSIMYICMMFGLSRLNYQSSAHSHHISKKFIVVLLHCFASPDTKQKSKLSLKFWCLLALLWFENFSLRTSSSRVVANIKAENPALYVLQFTSKEIMSTNPLSAGFLICFWQEALSLLANFFFLFFFFSSLDSLWYLKLQTQNSF